MLIGGRLCCCLAQGWQMIALTDGGYCGALLKLVFYPLSHPARVG